MSNETLIEDSSDEDQQSDVESTKNGSLRDGRFLLYWATLTSTTTTTTYSATMYGGLVWEHLTIIFSGLLPPFTVRPQAFPTASVDNSAEIY